MASASPGGEVCHHQHFEGAGGLRLARSGGQGEAEFPGKSDSAKWDHDGLRIGAQGGHLQIAQVAGICPLPGAARPRPAASLLRAGGPVPRACVPVAPNRRPGSSHCQPPGAKGAAGSPPPPPRLGVRLRCPLQPAALKGASTPGMTGPSHCRSRWAMIDSWSWGWHSLTCPWGRSRLTGLASRHAVPLNPSSPPVPCVESQDLWWRDPPPSLLVAPGPCVLLCVRSQGEPRPGPRIAEPGGHPGGSSVPGTPPRVPRPPSLAAPFPLRQCVEENPQNRPSRASRAAADFQHPAKLGVSLISPASEIRRRFYFRVSGLSRPRSRRTHSRRSALPRAR